MRGVGKPAVLVRDDADRQRHQRHAVQLAAPILTEVIAGPPVLFVVLIRYQRVEHFEHLAARVWNGIEWDDEDEIVSADVPDEPPTAQQSLHDVVQNARHQVDDPIAVVVAVAIVELLEMVEVGIAYGEQLAVLHPPPDLALDLGRAGQAGGRVHRHVPRGPRQEPVEPARLLHRLEQWADHLVRTRVEPFLHPVGRVPARQHGQRNDCRVGVPLQAAAELQALGTAVGIDHQELGQRPEHALLHVRRVENRHDREPPAIDPACQEVGYRTTRRREEEYRRARAAHLPPRVRVERA